MVQIRAVKALPRLITLDELRKVKGLEKMVLLQRGSRLSIQPVRPEEWDTINSMA
jgi:predicted RNA-binding protein with PUA-like domain